MKKTLITETNLQFKSTWMKKIRIKKKKNPQNIPRNNSNFLQNSKTKNNWYLNTNSQLVYSKEIGPKHLHSTMVIKCFRTAYIATSQSSAIQSKYVVQQIKIYNFIFTITVYTLQKYMKIVTKIQK